MINLSVIKENQPLRIIIGASGTSYPGWISTEEEDLNLLRRHDWEESFKDRKIDIILAEHVWEHMTEQEGEKAAKICFDFLKPGGFIRCAVPDKYFRDDWYQNMVQVGGPGPKDHPAAGHKIVYTYNRLKDVFERVGFKVNLLEYFDEKEEFHYNDWDPKDGKIGRSLRFDTRNRDGVIKMASIIIDAIKPNEE